MASFRLMPTARARIEVYLETPIFVLFTNNGSAQIFDLSIEDIV